MYGRMIHVAPHKLLPIRREFKVFGASESDKSWFRLVTCSDSCKHPTFPKEFNGLDLKGVLGPVGVRLHSPFNAYYRFAIDVFNFLSSIDQDSQDFHFEFGGKLRGHYYLIRLFLWLYPEGSNFFDFREVDKEVIKGNLLLNQFDLFVLEAIHLWGSIESYPKNVNLCLEVTCDSSVLPTIDRPVNNSLDIIIPTRNVPTNEVIRCLESIGRQMIEGDKIYLVDDNDESMKELDEYSRKHPHIVFLIGDKCGVASARNKGMNAGFNGLVAFVDSDDYILPGYLDIQRSFHFKNSQIAATGTWLQGFGNSSVIYPQWDGFNPLGLIMCLPPAGVLTWKRSILHKYKFDLSFKAGFEDFDLVARVIAQNYSIAVLDLPLYMYQRGHVSLSQSWSQSKELELRSKVNSNVNSLCRHKLSEVFVLFSEYGKKLLISHPDLVFREGSRVKKEIDSLSIIANLRNVSILRRVWRILPEKSRFAVFTFLTRNI